MGKGAQLTLLVPLSLAPFICFAFAPAARTQYYTSHATICLQVNCWHCTYTRNVQQQGYGSSWLEGLGSQDYLGSAGNRNSCCCQVPAPGPVQVYSLAADSDAASNSKTVLAGVQAGRPWSDPPFASSAPSICPGVWGVIGTALAPMEDRPCSAQSPMLHVKWCSAYYQKPAVSK